MGCAGGALEVTSAHSEVPASRMVTHGREILTESDHFWNLRGAEFLLLQYKIHVKIVLEIGLISK